MATNSFQRWDCAGATVLSAVGAFRKPRPPHPGVERQVHGEDEDPLRDLDAPSPAPAGAAGAAGGAWAGVQVTHKPLEGLPAWVHHTYALAAEGGTADAAGAAGAGSTVSFSEAATCARICANAEASVLSIPPSGSWTASAME